MTRDILSDVGYLGIGSRLKRLSDRLLADAALVHEDSGEPIQPGQFPLIAALDRYGELTVNGAASVLGTSQPAATRAITELVKAGLAQSIEIETDRRQRTISLTPAGVASVERMKRSMWPRVETAARDLFSNLSGDFLAQLDALEQRLAGKSMHQRVRDNPLEIVPYSDDLARDFRDINVEWIESMFSLEDEDRNILENPGPTILDHGGEILFVRSADLGLVGTCALKPDTHGFTELTKMGVLSSARGQKAGEFLLRAIIERAQCRDMVEKLYLVTNTKCAPAIHLYEKTGFVHDDEIMQLFGSRYQRCDVAMRYRP